MRQALLVSRKRRNRDRDLEYWAPFKSFKPFAIRAVQTFNGSTFKAGLRAGGFHVSGIPETAKVKT
jgi:hypothetical protein